MKVNKELTILELPLDLGADAAVMNLSLITDAQHGLTLVDTGIPGQAGLIEQALEREGSRLAEIERIILTHQDLDHVGSLAALKTRIGARVLALSTEVPYIDGTLTPIKMPSAERLAQYPVMAERIKLWHPVPVDEALSDGQVLAEAAGALVVATPGHTPGHMSLYLPGTRTLITGDALMSESGTLMGPGERATPDMPTAMQSVKRLAALNVDTILCFHGGLVTQDAEGQLKRLAGTLMPSSA